MLDAGNVAEGASVGEFGSFAGEVGGGDDVDLVAEMIEGEDAIEKHKDAVGDIEIVDGEGSDVFEAADDVVGAIADGSGGEGRKAIHGGGTVSLEEFLDDVEDVAGAALGFFGAGTKDFDFGSTRFEAEKRADTEKGVATDFFSAFDGFEQEGVRLVGSDREKGGDGSEQIGGD